ncbi:carboxypeptidase regulatory-like domain-containing protein, partial [Pseudomonadota bacterium]
HTAGRGTDVAGAHLVALATEQPSGSLPAGITLTFLDPVDLVAGESAEVTVQLTGTDAAAPADIIILTAKAADSGSVNRGQARIDYQLADAQPFLVPEPASVNTGVARGDQVTETVSIQNQGLIPALAVTAELLDESGTGPAPDWISLASPAALGDIGVGSEAAVQVVATPTAAVLDGLYFVRIRIASDNAVGGDIPFTVAVTQSGDGDVEFRVIDMFTNTLDEGGQLIEGLAGATVKVQHETVPGIEQSAVTDAAGEALITGLPAGRYRFRVSALDHSDTAGGVIIRPGGLAQELVFLELPTVSFEWSVVETTIEDRYEVRLEALYRTFVPAPVLVFEPALITIPDLQPGEFISGEITLSNYGLIRVTTVDFGFPQSNEYYDFEFVGTMPDQLEAMERVTFSYRVTAKAPSVVAGTESSDRTVSSKPLASSSTESSEDNCRVEARGYLRCKWVCEAGVWVKKGCWTEFYFMRYCDGEGGQAPTPYFPPGIWGGAGAGGGGGGFGGGGQSMGTSPGCISQSPGSPPRPGEQPGDWPNYDDDPCSRY